MDSTTCLSQAIRDGNDEILAVTCFYGSKHAAAEVGASRQIVEWYNSRGIAKVDQRIIELPNIFRGSGSALMNEVNMPQMSYADIHESFGPSPTVVPFRNANLISVATTLAIGFKATSVYIAAHADDAHNWAYPDCTPEFLGAMAAAVYIGSYHAVTLRFPFVWMTKANIVACAEMAPYAPLGLTWSCYEDGLQQCGTCPTCIERIHAFRVNGWKDRRTYEAPVDWMNLPEFPY
jgi:7-cyano-7-deazaguanine synthase